MVSTDDPGLELNLTSSQRRTIDRTASEYEKWGKWVKVSTLAFEAAERNEDFKPTDAYVLPRRFGWITNDQTVELSALGLLFAETAPATQHAMVWLVETCVQRSMALRDEARLSEQILVRDYLPSPFTVNRAEELARKIPGLAGSGSGGEDWWFEIPWTALDYRNVHSVGDLRLHLSMMAVFEIRAEQRNVGLSAIGIGLTQNDGGTNETVSTSNDSDPGHDDLWNPGLIRAFLSHLAIHRDVASRLSTELRNHGIDAFVAHEDVTVTREWQTEIERALTSAEVFVALTHPESSGSIWIQQEIGWALGRQLPIFIVRLGEDPLGFPTKFQWPSMVASTAPEVAAAISEWVRAVPGIAQPGSASSDS
jgi:hypothetical protein